MSMLVHLEAVSLERMEQRLKIRTLLREVCRELQLRAELMVNEFDL